MKIKKVEYFDDDIINLKIKEFGVSNLAKELNISVSLIYLWLQDRRIISIDYYNKIKKIVN